MAAHLLFDVKGQKIIRMDTFFAVEKSVGYLTAKFNFLSEEWQGKSVTAVFSRSDNTSLVKYMILDDENECLVPSEVMMKAGDIRVSVFAGASELVTTNYALVYLNPTGYAVGDEALDPPSPNAYEQMTDYFDESRQEVYANKEFVREAVEKFSHIHGGTFQSDDWTGEETEDDPQNATIQIRGGDDTAFDGEKLREYEPTISDDGRLRIKTGLGEVAEFTNKSDFDRLSTNFDNLFGDYSVSSGELNELIGHFDQLRQFCDGTVVNGYVGDDGCLYLTNAAGVVVVGPLGPFAGGSGGGGGGGEAYSRITLENTTPGGQRAFIITEDESIKIKFTWSSIDSDTGQDTGSGSYTLYRTGSRLYTRPIEQGEVEVDLTDYVNSGDNDFRITVADLNGQQRSIIYNVTKVALSISSDFDSSLNYSGDIPFSCVPTGMSGQEKFVKYEIDGEVVYTSMPIRQSGVRASHAIPAQTHGAHVLKVWVEATVNENIVKSPELYYEILCYEAGNANTVIASNFNVTEAVQYTPLNIEYRAYSSRSTSVDVTITTVITDTQGNITTTESQKTVSRGTNNYDLRVDTVGTTEVTIRAGAAHRTFTITVTESDINAKAATEDMVLYLSSASRSNDERNPGVWTYGTITTDFSNFDWTSSGWVVDSEGDVGLRLVNDARAVINYKPNEIDWKNTGKTVEIELASHTVSDYNAKIVQCFVDGRGFYITPTKLVLKYIGGSIEVPFKENSKNTFAIAVEKETTSFDCYRLVRLYINGICSAVVQYPLGANFAQPTGDAANIVIGSNDCGVTVYKIRIYDTELERRQIVDNWIVDTHSIEKMLLRYTNNNIFDERGKILLSKLPEQTPYLIISTPSTLPTKKKDPAVLVSGYFVWPENMKKSFRFYDAELTVQGTSSEAYVIKNWKLKFATGLTLISTGEVISKFKMRDNSVGINKPCLKADYASSESANNVVLVRLYNDINVYKTPHQQAEIARAENDPDYEARDIRQGIDGFGMMMFRATDNDLRSKVRANSIDLNGIADLDVSFMGKYNFNNDKGNEDVFGFVEGDESWEWLVNSGGIVNMLDGLMDDWDSEVIDDSGNTAIAWTTQLEGRYPDGNEDYTNIKQFIDFVKSTDVVTPLKSDQEKMALGITSTYLTPEQQATLDAESDIAAKTLLDNQYREAFKDARLRKFHDHIGDWIELNAFAFNFVFKDFFLMCDNWSKNAFWTRMHDTVNGVEVQSKWFDLPYDMDTAIGIDNNGNLVYDYFLEGTDHIVTIAKNALDQNKTYDIINESLVDGETVVTLVEWASDPLVGVRSRDNVYNGQDNTLYVNWQNPNSNYGHMDLSREVYRGLRSSGALTYEKVRDMFTQHQAAWSENMFNEDGEVKFLSVLYDTGSNAHLPKLLGSKASQRDYWLYYRFLYEDSKYIAGSGADYIETRTYAPSENVTITPAITSYVTAMWGNNGIYVQKRTHAGEAAELASTMGGAAGANDNVLYIYCAEMVEDLGDLSGNMLGYIDVGKGYNITRLKVGDSDSNYLNPNMLRITFRTLESGAEYPMCKVVDARNCSNLGSGNNNTPEVIYLKSCTNLEEAYFEGTSAKGLDLPTTGTLKKIHYSASTNSVIIQNQPNITELVVPTWNTVSTVVLENVGDVVNMKNIYSSLKDKASVRLSGFEWTANSVSEITDWLDAIDAKQFDWLDENLHSTRIAGQSYEDQERALNCTIYIDDITGAQVSQIREKWIGIKIVASSLTAVCTFMNGNVVVDTCDVFNGGNATYSGETPTKASDSEFNYTFAGWALTPDATEPYDGALTGITEDRTVYAVYTATHKNFTVRFFNDAALLDTCTVEYGSHPVYSGSTPVSATARPFTGWTYNSTSFVEDLATIAVTTDMDFYATFLSTHTVVFFNGNRRLQELTVNHGATAVYSANTPRSSTGAPFIGWSPDNGTTLISNLSTYPIYTDTNFTAQFTPTYTVRFFRYATDQAPIYVQENVLEHANASYSGEVFTGDHGEALLDWSPSVMDVTEDRDCVAVFETLYKCEYFVGDTLFYTDNYLHYGDNSTCPNEPTMSGKKFAGWVPSPNNITRDTKVYATFGDTYFVKYYANEDAEQPLYTDEGLEAGDDSTYVGNLPVGPYNAPFVAWDPVPENVQSNMYVYATYEPRYTVRFLNETGSVTYHTQNGIAPNGHPEYPSNAATPTKNGYEFIGWSADNGVTVYTTFTNVSINHDTDYYAQFRKLNSVTFYNGSTVLSTNNNVSTGSTASYTGTTPVDEVSGGTFLGWHKDNDTTNLITNLSTITITADTNFYAVFSTAYVVTFYADDNDVTPYEVVKGVAPGGTATPTKGNPTKSGYIFVDWDPAPTNIQGNINVYANWEQVYIVRYIVDGTAVQSSTTVRAGQTYAYTGTTPTKNGYEFTGWSPTPGAVNADTDYVAQWIQLHTVRFMDGATVLQTVNNVRHGEYASYTSTAPTKSGYRFTGWNNDPASTPINADTDFTAQWIQLHTVRFMADGVAVQTITNVDHGSTVTFTEAEPTKSGYDFDGWDKDPASTVINADTDFVAQWVEATNPLDELYAALDDGTYSTKYSVGDKITIPIDGVNYETVILGIGTDVDANDNPIPITLGTVDLVGTMQMNTTSTNAGGWEASAGRTTVAGYESKLPEGIQVRLAAAKKYSYDKTTSADKITYDKLWIPSCKELGLGYDTNGPVYSGVYTDNASRIKKLNGTANYYWTRTASSSYASYFRYVTTSGGADGNSAYGSYGVALGFCLTAKLKSAEEIAWDNLAASIQNGTVTTDYSVGDTIPYTTTDGDTYHAQIVGFGKDVDENGQTIPVSFITQELNKTNYPMNATSTNSGGWNASVMRTSTMPALKAKLPEYVTKHIVAAKKYSYDKTSNTEQTTIDEVWIPNFKELGFTSNQESGGAAYSDVFTDNTARVKKILGSESANYYWTRTAGSSDANGFRSVNTSGGANGINASSSNGVALGFCFG